VCFVVSDKRTRARRQSLVNKYRQGFRVSKKVSFVMNTSADGAREKTEEGAEVLKLVLAIVIGVLGLFELNDKFKKNTKAEMYMYVELRDPREVELANLSSDEVAATIWTINNVGERWTLAEEYLSRVWKKMLIIRCASRVNKMYARFINTKAETDPEPSGTPQHYGDIVQFIKYLRQFNQALFMRLKFMNVTVNRNLCPMYYRLLELGVKLDSSLAFFGVIDATPLSIDLFRIELDKMMVLAISGLNDYVEFDKFIQFYMLFREISDDVTRSEFSTFAIGRSG